MSRCHSMPPASQNPRKRRQHSMLAPHTRSVTLLRHSSRALLLTTLLSLPTSHSFSLPSIPSSPPSNPAHDPTGERLVKTQLLHYQTSNLSDAYLLCSPWNQEATGSLQDFEELVKTPPYDLILGHERADIMMEVLPDKPKGGQNEGTQAACYLVCIKPGKNARKRYPVWFWWEVSRHFLEDEDGDLVDNDVEGEWRVDCVMPDFEDLDFEAESLAQYLGDEEEEDDDDFDGMTFYLDFGL
ncbi:hypothetical protein HJC23_000755 [Cyclotella cryptica]|uniref:Uncharacterized protein n=1 Tax=Cyclotella cryptica TaxID=29204 RepID=A0ABD3PYT1_9STRA